MLPYKALRVIELLFTTDSVNTDLISSLQSQCNIVKRIHANTLHEVRLRFESVRDDLSLDLSQTAVMEMVQSLESAILVKSIKMVTIIPSGIKCNRPSGSLEVPIPKLFPSLDQAGLLRLPCPCGKHILECKSHQNNDISNKKDMRIMFIPTDTARRRCR